MSSALRPGPAACSSRQEPGSLTGGEVRSCCSGPRRPGAGPRPEAPSGGEGGHLQGDPLPQLLGLLPPLEVLQDIVELHHPHRRQAERTAGAADDVDEVVVVSRGQVDEPVVDVLWAEERQVETGGEQVGAGGNSWGQVRNRWEQVRTGRSRRGQMGTGKSRWEQMGTGEEQVGDT